MVLIAICKDYLIATMFLRNNLLFLLKKVSEFNLITDNDTIAACNYWINALNIQDHIGIGTSSHFIENPVTNNFDQAD